MIKNYLKVFLKKRNELWIKIKNTEIWKINIKVID
jgi:hypothetical protein